MNKLTAAQKTNLASLIEVTGFNLPSLGKVKINDELEMELFIQLTIEVSFINCSTIGVSLTEEVYENDVAFKAFRTYYGMAIATEVFDVKVEDLSDLDAEMFLQSQIETELSAVKE